MAAYYNEHDPQAAQWLRNLIAHGLIAPGDVDERSIVDVRADDLRRYVQCHFFAGIGVWSYALRLAGWDDARPVWTGSCPCQPFSAAGKGEGYGDERHLWPHWYRLIGECRPPTIFGEQVDAAIRTGWLDDVCLSLESIGYAVGAVDFPACSVGAPHIRQRLYFVAESERRTAERHGLALAATTRGSESEGNQRQRLRNDAFNGRDACAVADDDGQGCDRLAPSRLHERRPGTCGDESAPGSADGPRRHDADGCGESDVVGDAERAGSQGFKRSGDVELHRGSQSVRPIAETGATNGFWRDAEWIACRDGKARPTEPGTFPLANGAAARVVRLRAYGNAIVAEQARAFIESYMT